MHPHRPTSVVAAVAVVLGLLVAAAPAGSAATGDDPAPPSPTEPCDSLSPVAIPCVALGKTTDAVAAECRRVGLPEPLCLLPFAHKVTQAARDAYQVSWVHQAARFQYALGNALPLSQAQWLGTHNSLTAWPSPSRCPRPTPTSSCR